jgi:hypothetical protein
MNRLGAALVAWGLIAAHAGAASPDPKDLAVPPQDQSRAQGLVRKLASEVFKEREAAQDELAKMGRLAIPALQEAAAVDPSPEVRARVSRLLPRAEAADLQARIDTFLADADGKFEHQLPAWKLYRTEAGADKAARELYVEMLKSQPNLEILLALETSAAAGGRMVADRRAALWLQMNPHAFGRFNPAVPVQPKQPTLVDLATLLFAEIVVPTKDIPRAGPFFVTLTGATILQQSQAGINAINNPGGVPHADVFRKVLVRWLDTRVVADDLNYVVYVAQQMRTVKEAASALRRVVTTDGVQAYQKAQAMLYLAQRGGKDELPVIKSQLKNETTLNARIQLAPGLVIDSQVRDIALALCLHLDGQDLKAYGYEFQNGFNQANVINNYWGYGFTDDDKRAAAHKKWAEYEAKPKPELAPPPRPVVDK